MQFHFTYSKLLYDIFSAHRPKKGQNFRSYHIINIENHCEIANKIKFKKINIKF